MTFSTFSLQVLLDKGTALLACGGQVRAWKQVGDVCVTKGASGHKRKVRAGRRL